MTERIRPLTQIGIRQPGGVQDQRKLMQRLQRGYPGGSFPGLNCIDGIADNLRQGFLDQTLTIPRPLDGICRILVHGVSLRFGVWWRQEMG